MSETLEEVRDRLQRLYLGKARVHGLGISRKQKALRVYVASGGGPEQETLLEELREAAQPYLLLVIWEEPAVASKLEAR